MYGRVYVRLVCVCVRVYACEHGYACVYQFYVCVRLRVRAFACVCAFVHVEIATLIFVIFFLLDLRSSLGVPPWPL